MRQHSNASAVFYGVVLMGIGLSLLPLCRISDAFFGSSVSVFVDGMIFAVLRAYSRILWAVRLKKVKRVMEKRLIQRAFGVVLALRRTLNKRAVKLQEEQKQ